MAEGEEVKSISQTRDKINRCIVLNAIGLSDKAIFFPLLPQNKELSSVHKGHPCVFDIEIEIIHLFPGGRERSVEINKAGVDLIFQ